MLQLLEETTVHLSTSNPHRSASTRLQEWGIPLATITTHIRLLWHLNSDGFLGGNQEAHGRRRRDLLIIRLLMTDAKDLKL